MTALHDLASEAGLLVQWQDAAGEAQTVSDESLKLVLDALGFPASSEAETVQSRRSLANRRSEAARSFITAKVGEPVILPSGLAGPFTLELEGGERREIEAGTRELDGIAEPGYHRLRHGGGETVIAVAPPRCIGVEDIMPQEKAWGVAAQLSSLQSDPPGPFGDLGILAEAARALGQTGADLLAISPVHALFPAEPARFSPYAPSSRRFLNILLADPALAGGVREECRYANDLIDWKATLPRRLAMLRHLFDAMEPDERERITRIERVTSTDIRSQALFDALHEHFSVQGKHGWQDWPSEYRHPGSPAIREFATKHDDQIAFFAWAQGLADKSLAAAHSAAREAGMAFGIVSDLAVGIDPGGADCWSSPDAFLNGLSVGAPPDLLGPEGQDWGLTTFDPLALHTDRFEAFRATLSAAMAHAGGVRIDHILGIRRIWVVPHGRKSAEGCYLTMPQDDLTNILALESWRNRCIVIGEDLGTVPEGFRDEMASSLIYGMRVMAFERDDQGGYTDPSIWDREAAAMTSTHDLATLAGYWEGRDIDWTWKIGRKSRFEDETEERSARKHERAALWDRFAASGPAKGPPPDKTERFVTAAIAHVADSACEIALIPFEDLFGVVEQPNLPGTIDQHPNWRRRLPDTVENLLKRPEVQCRIAALVKARPA